MRSCCLLVLSKSLAPPYDANYQDIKTLINVFSNFFECIDIVYTSYFKNNLLFKFNKKVRNIYFIKRSKNILNLISFYPHQIKSREVNKIFVNLIEKYDLIFFHGHSVLKTISNLNDFKGKIYLRVNNDERNYFLNLSMGSKNVIKKIYYYTEYLKYIFFYRFFLKTFRINKFLFASNKNLKEEKKIPKNKKIFFPCEYIKNNLDINKKKNYVLYIGSLNLDQNYNCILWYIKHVHPKILVNGYKFFIVGSLTNRKKKNKLEFITSQYNNIKLNFNVKNLNPFYKKSKLFINPVKFGDGLKVKNIYAMSYNVPVITTTCGNEGTKFNPNQDIYVANSSKEFVNSISILLSDKKKRKQLIINSKSKLRKFYNLNQIFKKII